MKTDSTGQLMNAVRDNIDLDDPWPWHNSYIARIKNNNNNSCLYCIDFNKVYIDK